MIIKNITIEALEVSCRKVFSGHSCRKSWKLAGILSGVKPGDRLVAATDHGNGYEKGDQFVLRAISLHTENMFGPPKAYFLFEGKRGHYWPGNFLPLEQAAPELQALATENQHWRSLESACL